jgi:hypothetical protein
MKQYQEKWQQGVQRMDTNRIPKQALQHKPKDEGTEDDRGRDGGTNFILRIKEQETHLILHERDDGDIKRDLHQKKTGDQNVVPSWWWTLMHHIYGMNS